MSYQSSLAFLQDQVLKSFTGETETTDTPEPTPLFIERSSILYPSVDSTQLYSSTPLNQSHFQTPPHLSHTITPSYSYDSSNSRLRQRTDPPHTTPARAVHGNIPRLDIGPLDAVRSTYTDDTEYARECLSQRRMVHHYLVPPPFRSPQTASETPSRKHITSSHSDAIIHTPTSIDPHPLSAEFHTPTLHSFSTGYQTTPCQDFLIDEMIADMEEKKIKKSAPKRQVDQKPPPPAPQPPAISLHEISDNPSDDEGKKTRKKKKRKVKPSLWSRLTSSRETHRRQSEIDAEREAELRRRREEEERRVQAHREAEEQRINAEIEQKIHNFHLPSSYYSARRQPSVEKALVNCTYSFKKDTRPHHHEQRHLAEPLSDALMMWDSTAFRGSPTASRVSPLVPQRKRGGFDQAVPSYPPAQLTPSDPHRP